MKKCATDLPCGHVCDYVCHIIDREHKEFKCQKPCDKLCPNEHLCPSNCWIKCPPCQVTVERTLKCNHPVKMPCSANVETFKCYTEVNENNTFTL